jgi:hypothetical protein
VVATANTDMQCIMLATRPFLFVLIEMCASSDDPQVEIPVPVKLLLQISLESAKKSLLILSALQAQSLLGMECTDPALLSHCNIFLQSAFYPSI